MVDRSGQLSCGGRERQAGGRGREVLPYCAALVVMLCGGGGDVSCGCEGDSDRVWMMMVLVCGTDVWLEAPVKVGGVVLCRRNDVGGRWR